MFEWFINDLFRKRNNRDRKIPKTFLVPFNRNLPIRESECSPDTGMIAGGALIKKLFHLRDAESISITGYNGETEVFTLDSDGILEHSVHGDSNNA